MKASLHMLMLCMGLFSLSIIWSSCEKEDDPLRGVLPKGQVQFQVTDAPIDNPEINGAYVTISGIYADSDSNLLSEKVTIDLLAYQNGNVKIIGDANIDVGNYKNLEIALDLQSDMWGNSPGCYITTSDGSKHNLAPSTQLEKRITPGTDFNVEEDMSAIVVIDFDLRKGIKMDSSSTAVKYQFTSDNNLTNAIRVMSRLNTGSLMGTLEGNSGISEKVVVYAYKAGEYDEHSEPMAQGTDQITFRNAVNSALVQHDGQFVLPFLAKGDYELVFAGYHDEDQDGEMEYIGTLITNGLLGINLGNINLEASNTVEVNVSANGFLPL